MNSQRTKGQMKIFCLKYLANSLEDFYDFFVVILKLESIDKPEIQLRNSILRIDLEKW